MEFRTIFKFQDGKEQVLRTSKEKIWLQVGEIIHIRERVRETTPHYLTIGYTTKATKRGRIREGNYELKRISREWYDERNKPNRESLLETTYFFERKKPSIGMGFH